MYEQLLNLTNKITNTDLIVWPETVLPTVIETPQLFSRIKDLAKEKNANLIFGSQTAKKENSKILYFNSAFLISNKGELTGIYNKIHLVPFGEYVPLVKYFPFLKRLTPIEEGFTPGSEYSIFSLLSSNYKLSTIICFEDIFPGLSRKFVKQGANILVNLTNDAWYDKTCAVYQHAYLSVFRAVENSVPLIRATNTGLSCFIDYRGKIDKITPFVPISEAREVFIPKNSTFYTRFGDVFGWTCVISLLLSIAGGIYVRRTTKRIIST
jgi:apolipoprotein N-acyltransferase